MTAPEDHVWVWDDEEEEGVQYLRATPARLHAEELAVAMREIVDGYGPNHLSKFARDKATAVLAKLDQP